MRIYYTRRGQFALGQNVPGGTYSPRADCPGGGGGGGGGWGHPVLLHQCMFIMNVPTKLISCITCLYSVYIKLCSIV